LGLRAHNGGNGFEMSYPSNPLEPGVKYHVVAEYNLKYQSYSIHVYDETGESVLRSMENFSRRSGYDQVDYIDSMNFYSEEEGFYTVYNVTSRGWDLEDPDDGRFPSSPYPEANKYLFHGANDDLLAYEGTVVVDFDLRVNAPMDGNANSFGIIGPGGGNWDSFAQLGYRARFAGTMLQAYNADGFYYEQSTTLNPGDLYHITLTAVLPEYRYSLTATDSGGNTRIIADGYSGRNGYDQIAGAYGLIFASPGVDDYSVYNVSVRQEEYVPDDPVEPGSGRRLTVGSGGSYSAIQDAIDASEPGDVILINANDEWHNTGALAVVNKPDITIRGVASLDDESSTSKKAIMSVDPGVILQRKGIWIVTGPAAHVYIENIEFAGAHDTDAQDKNWSGVRVETAVGLVFRGCAFHNNDDGVLAGAGGAGSGVAFYRCEFYENGFGDGQSHNLYIGKVESLYFIDSYSHYPNADAHILKSRAANNYIINSVLAEENADSEHFSNSNIDISEGGNLYVAGCTLHQATVPETGAGWGNYSVVTYGLENGAANPGRDVAFVNNTVVDDMWDEAEAQWGPVLAFGGAVAPESVALAMRNNLYAGKAPVVIFANGGRADLTDEYFAAESGNLIVRDIAEIAFRNAAAFDYRLTSGSVAAIDKGVAPEPENEAMGAYFESRAVHGAAIDIGAYEFDGASDPGDHGDGATQEEIGRLERLARRADGLIHELYTANSATALEKAAADALALVGAGESGGGAPTKAGIAGARQAITAALRGLRIADQYDNRRYYEALAAEVARAEELDPEKYTAASWERVETPLANAWSDLTNEFVFEPQSAPQGAVGGNSGLLPFDISYTDPQIAAERNKIIQDLLALRAALDNLEAHPEYDPSDLPTLTVGVHEAKSEEWLLVQQPGEPVIGFSVKSDSGASGAAEIHLRLSYSAADFEALEVLFAENGGGFEKFVSLPSELGGATLTKPARMKTPLFDGYLTYSVSIVAEAGNAFDVGEGGAILDIALPLLNPGAGGSKAVSLILSNLEATVYPDGYGDIGGGAAISDVNVSIGPFVATTIIRYRDRFDVTLDGRLTLADVAMVRRCMGLKADGGGIWTPAEAERCDLGGKEGDIDVDMPDGEIDTSDLTLIMAAYEATLL
jgi:hypothetical protein